MAQKDIQEALKIAEDNAGLSCPLSSDACGEYFEQIRDLLRKSVELKSYPTFSEYQGGGTILDEYTTLKNVISECAREGIDFIEVVELIRGGNEVLIQSGEIKAVKGKANGS